MVCLLCHGKDLGEIQGSYNLIIHFQFNYFIGYKSKRL